MNKKEEVWYMSTIKIDLCIYYCESQITGKNGNSN